MNQIVAGNGSQTTTRQEFLRSLERQLEIGEGSLSENLRLTEVEGWDSLAAVLFIALADKLGVAVSGREIAQAATVGDLLNLLGGRLAA